MSHTKASALSESCAFPTTLLHPETGEPKEQHSGLTVRELFAAMAMQGMNSNSDLSQNEKEIANWAVQQADALINALTDKVTR